MADIDPISKRLVPCGKVYTSPLEWIRQVHRLRSAGHSLEEISTKTNIPVSELERRLYIESEGTPYERMDYLIDHLMSIFDITDGDKIGKAKATIWELLIVNLKEFR